MLRKPTQVAEEMWAPAHSPTSKMPPGCESSMLVALLPVKLEFATKTEVILGMLPADTHHELCAKALCDGSSNRVLTAGQCCISPKLGHQGILWCKFGHTQAPMLTGELCMCDLQTAVSVNTLT